MSQRQWKRLDVVERIGQGKLTLDEAATVLGLSGRQVRRLRRAVERRGAKGVLHGNTGRTPAHRVADAVREQIIELRRKKYDRFNFNFSLAVPDLPQGYAPPQACVSRNPVKPLSVKVLRHVDLRFTD